MTKELTDILTDPQKYKQYQQDLTKYGEQAQIFGYGGTLGKFLSTLGLGQYGSGILEKGIHKPSKSSFYWKAWIVDFKTGWKLASNPETWKIPTEKEKTDMKQRVAALKRSMMLFKNCATRDHTLVLQKR